MCGIAGYAGTRELDRETLERCLARMRHRGPDAAGCRSFRTPAGRNVHVLATRLDIIDLHERSNQPLTSGPATIAYNGELYNYLEVRSALERRGRTFATEGDTEVMLATLAEGGADALDDCEGMWALALYDERDGSLTLSRDRFGEKPLYLYRDATGLYWGSEPKCIFELLGRTLEPNVEHVYRYLVNGYKALYKQPQTFFLGLEEVPAATALRVAADGSEDRVRHWEPAVGEDDALAYDEAVADVRERLIRAVELRLRADVPLAFMMSGGVDSLSLIAIAKRVLGYDVHGFTLVEEDERYSESALVAHAVDELALRHTAVPTETADFLPRLRALVVQHDAPVYTISYYAHWLLMRAVADAGYRISVSGTGADELFTGYYDHHLAYLHDVQGEDGLHERARAAWDEHVRPLVRNPFLSDGDYFVRDPGRREHVYLNADRFAATLKRPWNEPFAEAALAPGLLRNRMLNELLFEAVPVILHEDDLNAMSFSVENRSPYLDRALYEASARIPVRHLVRDAYAKAVLRDAVAGILPERVRTNRRKVGFNAPIRSFLDTADPEVRAELLREGPIFEHVRSDAIERLLDAESLPNSESKFLFNFVNAKLFLEEFS